jgi:hypothetical protein
MPSNIGISSFEVFSENIADLSLTSSGFRLDPESFENKDYYIDSI